MNKGNIILFSVILVLVLVIGVGVGWLIVSGSKSDDSEKASAAQHDKDEPTAKKYDLAKTTAVAISEEPIVSNLKTENVNEKKVIRVKAKLRVITDKVITKEVQENTSIAIDILLDILRSKTAEEMLKPEAKQQIKTEILQKVNKAFHTDKIVDMHFEDFIVQ